MREPPTQPQASESGVTFLGDARPSLFGTKTSRKPAKDGDESSSSYQSSVMAPIDDPKTDVSHLDRSWIAIGYSFLS